MYRIITIICGFILQAHSSLILRSLNSNETIELEDADALFGAKIKDGLPWGNVSESTPKLACSGVAPPPLDGVFFALADRGHCNFVDKVLAIQKAHYLGAIIVNTESDFVFPMGSDKDVNVTIPAVMVGRSSGMKIREHYLYDKLFMAQMTPNPPSSLEYYLVPLLIALSLAFLGIIIFLCFRVLRNCLRQSKNRLSRDILNKLPEIRYSEDYRNLYDTCAICLEDYQIGDKLRVLPCHHAYHSKCVDRWLLRRQRSCPVCKYRIHRARDEQDSDDEEPQQTTGEGPSVGSAGTTTTVEPSEGIPPLRSGRTLPGSIISVAYEAGGEDTDVAPLLSKSAPVALWLSGGQLPQHESTWLGYDNQAVEDDDDEEMIDRPSRPSPKIEKSTESLRLLETHPYEISNVSVLNPSSSNLSPVQSSTFQATIPASEERNREAGDGAEGKTDQEFTPLVDV